MSQETRTRKQDLQKKVKETQEKVDLKDVLLHEEMVTNIVYALRHIAADLMDHNLDNARNGERRFLEIRFNYLESEDLQNYINTFGPFYRLYKSLKERYEKEVFQKSTISNLIP